MTAYNEEIAKLRAKGESRKAQVSAEKQAELKHLADQLVRQHCHVTQSQSGSSRPFNARPSLARLRDDFAAVPQIHMKKAEGTTPWAHQRDTDPPTRTQLDEHEEIDRGRRLCRGRPADGSGRRSQAEAGRWFVKGPKIFDWLGWVRFFCLLSFSCSGLFV